MAEYIDVEEFITEMNERIKSAIEWGKNADSEEIKTRAEQAIATFCEASLTAMKMNKADVAPVIHAKMMRTDEYPHRIYCGICYRTLVPNEEHCFERNLFPKWCMWCGAKMDEEEDNGKTEG